MKKAIVVMDILTFVLFLVMVVLEIMDNMYVFALQGFILLIVLNVVFMVCVDSIGSRKMTFIAGLQFVFILIGVLYYQNVHIVNGVWLLWLVPFLWRIFKSNKYFHQK